MPSNKPRSSWIDRVQALLRDHGEPLVLVLVVAVLLRLFVWTSYYVGSHAMEPTLLKGDFILGFTSSFGFRLPGSSHFLTQGQLPRRGELVVLQCPHSDDLCLKRVVGLPGDRIELVKQRLMINNVLCNYEKATGSQKNSVLEEKCPEFHHQIDMSKDWDPISTQVVVLKPDQIYLLNDARGDVSDSRTWGPVSKNNLRAKPLVVWMSLAWNSSDSGFQFRWDRLFQSWN
ncbi:MAG: signal peptidase I [Bdellovibrionales bacterium]|nr:signal peptidase I [Bdellovibrionales bacterium]